jgi:hypothetical protein
MPPSFRTLAATVLALLCVCGACHPHFTILPTPLVVRRLPPSPYQQACVSLVFPPDFSAETRVVYPESGSMTTVYTLPMGNSMTNDFTAMLGRHYQQVRNDSLCPARIGVQVNRVRIKTVSSVPPHFSAAVQFTAQVWRPGMQGWFKLEARGTGIAAAEQSTILAPNINETALGNAWSNALFNALMDFERQAGPILGIAPIQMEMAPIALPSDRVWDRSPDDEN